jgi:hypothetical protein
MREDLGNDVNKFFTNNQNWNEITKDLRSCISRSKTRIELQKESSNLEPKINDPLLETLEEILPLLVASLKVDATISPWKQLWGLSRNFDVRMGCSLVDEEVIKVISGIAGVSAPYTVGSFEGCIAHAGLLHTYGYLFCDISSSLFGFKRDRWIHNIIESSFTLKSSCLSPFTEEGTLFSNVTYFIGRIAFRDLNEILMTLEQFSDRIDHSIVSVPYDKLKLIRITEEIIIDSQLISDNSSINCSEEEISVYENQSRVVRLFTDLVAPLIEGEVHILVYSVYDSLPNEYFLMTSFPIDQNGIIELLSKPKGDDVTITTRYNTYVEGITDKTFCGKRKVC